MFLIFDFMQILEKNKFEKCIESVGWHNDVPWKHVVKGWVFVGESVADLLGYMKPRGFHVTLM